MSIKRWNYFNEETEPKIIGVDVELMALVDRARHRAGIPFIVTSGLRTPEHNEAVGGVPNSEHTTGNALDFACRNSRECFKIVEALIMEGAQRIVIGIKPDGNYHNVHVGNGEDKPQQILSIKMYGG